MRQRARWLVVVCLLGALALSPACSPDITGDTSGETSTSAGTTETPAASPTVPATKPKPKPITFAVIGDYGSGTAHERDVAKLVASWNPAFIVTTGDDYYDSAGGKGTGKYDRSTGAYYGKWLKDISTTGTRHPVGSARVNAFFPTMGNHDLSDATPSPRTYLTYFTLPGSGFTNTSGNERYYDFVQGPVHFFVLDSNPSQPDGTSSTSKQARWLKRGLAASTSVWNVVCEHHPPYSSQTGRPSAPYMRWPFASWGADAVLSGHAHQYERVMRDGMPFFVNGLGGASRRRFSKPVDGSVARYWQNWGAQRVTVTDTTLTFQFIDVLGRQVDTFTLSAAPE